MKDPARLGDVLRKVLGRLGVPDPSLWSRISTEWDQIAGDPWARLSRPFALTGDVLVVEAKSNAAVAMLRYGTGGLKERLEEALGTGIVSEIRVKGPQRSKA